MADVSQISFRGETRNIKDETARQPLTYSTTETDTGKTWIDGKPIYRKVFDGLNIAVASDAWRSVVQLDETPDTLIDCQDVNSTNSGVGSIYITNTVRFYLNPTTKNINGLGSYYTTYIHTLIVEYTKN